MFSNELLERRLLNLKKTLKNLENLEYDENGILSPEIGNVGWKLHKMSDRFDK